MQEVKRTFPIENVLPQFLETFQHHQNIVLSAPPGAGKTTRVPLALLDSAWMVQKKLIMLEPRRLAARRAAEYMAAQLGEKVGQTIGYRIRGETVIGKQTRIEIVTEGILTRLLQSEPELHDVALIIFDEYHERSIHADLGLALTLDVQEQLRPDIRVLIMSATLNGISIAQFLNNAPIIESEGRSFPVSTHYAPSLSDKPMEIRIVHSIQRAITEQEGDILVFLPGRREIRKTENLLWEKRMPEDVIVHLLYGEASYQQQSSALSPDPKGRRKVILSTSIAETSLTIEGVRVVIDSGFARTARFDPKRGMSGLITVPVSKAVSDQRRGRAGRLESGVCYRLWTEVEHETLPDYPQPEIKTADLASLALDFAQWGTPRGEYLRFLDPPPQAHLLQAQTLLKNLSAVDISGKLTKHGRAMAALPIHPRLSHMILRGNELDFGSLACDIASLLEERDLLAGKKDTDIDLLSRLQMLQNKRTDDEGILERLTSQSHRLKKLLAIRSGTKKTDDYSAGLLLALAYPERIAKRKEANSNRYQMAGGTTAILPGGSLLAREEFIAIGDVDGLGMEVRVFLASPLRKEDLVRFFSDSQTEEEEIRWDPQEHVVIARHIIRLQSIILSERPMKPSGEKVLAAMIDGIRDMGIHCLPWEKESRSLQQRCQWLKRSSMVSSDIPDIGDTALLASLEQWLAPFLDGIWKKEQLSTLPLFTILQTHITRPLIQHIHSLAPTHLKLPSGSVVALDYSGDQPVLAVRLQELFGQVDTPKICNGKVNVLIHLLSPAKRPLAVTQDLHSFWTNVYPEIRTQMRARYPKHVWPEDPLSAKPTNKTKKRR